MSVEDLEVAGLESLDENPELVLELYKLAMRVGERLKSTLSVIPENYNTVRDRLGVRRFNEFPSDVLSVLAVDSTWSIPHLELVMGTIAVIVSGYVIVAPQGLGSYGLSFVALRFSGGDDDRFTLSLELSAKVKEYVTALRQLKRDVDIVMLDGPLYHSMIHEFYIPSRSSNVLEDSRRGSGSKLASHTSRALLDLLDKADSLGVPVAGVVKRVSSKLLLPRLEGLGGVVDVVRKYNDKLVASLILEPGEYIVIESYLEEFRKYLEAYSLKNVYRRILKIIDYCVEAPEDSLERRLCRYMERTAIAFYKHKGGSVAPQATRLDVYPGEDVDKVVAYCMENTTENNVPAPIDYVDRYVRIESQTIKRLHQLLRAHGKGQEVEVALNITNPQKKYLYE
ncbi:MAG: DNA double-strand break repair nuclease NurA [Acidilobaceae archaeon]